jgi:tRNA-dihydrouridine synthase A
MSNLPIVINGGIGSLDEAKRHLQQVDGVMLGRAAYQEPWRLLAVDREVFGADAPHATMNDALLAFLAYVEAELARGTRLHAMTRHLLGAFRAVPGARAFRRHLAQNAVRPGADVSVVRDALSFVGNAGINSAAA